MFVSLGAKYNAIHRFYNGELVKRLGSDFEMLGKVPVLHKTVI